jgi:hypothetical protein
MSRDARNDIISLGKDLLDLDPEVGERRSNGLEMRAHHFGATLCTIVIHVIGGNEALQD